MYFFNVVMWKKTHHLYSFFTFMDPSHFWGFQKREKILRDSLQQPEERKMSNSPSLYAVVLETPSQQHQF